MEQSQPFHSTIVEVFKTNVKDREHADMLLDQIHQAFDGYHASFDLEDCDRILRVVSNTGSMNAPAVIFLLKEFWCEAEAL